MTQNAILHCITEAKNAGSLWADQALAELSVITQNNYEFKRNVEPNNVKHEIVRVHARR